MQTQSTLTTLLKRSPELLTREEAAHYLGVMPNTLAVWACTKRYDLPFVKIGRLAKYRKADLDAFVERHMINYREKV